MSYYTRDTDGAVFVVWVIALLSWIIGLLIYWTSGALPKTGMTEEFGFWEGMWNGVFLIPTAIGSFFNDDWLLLASVNNGNLYVLGVIVGIIFLPSFWSLFRA